MASGRLIARHLALKDTDSTNRFFNGNEMELLCSGTQSDDVEELLGIDTIHFVHHDRTMAAANLFFRLEEQELRCIGDYHPPWCTDRDAK